MARIAALQDETKRLARELQQARMKAGDVGGGSGRAAERAGRRGRHQAGGARSVAVSTRTACARWSIAIAIRSRAAWSSSPRPATARSSIVVGVTPDLTKRVPAGQVVKQLAPIVGGGGGGRPDFAEAGGKDASKIAEMLAASRGVVEKMLSS